MRTYNHVHPFCGHPPTLHALQTPSTGPTNNRKHTSAARCVLRRYWFVGGYELDSAYKALTDIRPCGPKRDAIRGATHDLLSRSPPTQFEQLDPKAWATLAPEDRFALQWRVLRGAEAAAA